MNTEYTFMLKKIEKICLLCVQLSRYDKHSLARTTPVSNIFSSSKGVRANEVRLYLFSDLPE